MCGVIGIFGHPEAANLAYLGLHALQHRGQESAGIVSSDGEHLRLIREMGNVHEIFTADRLARVAWAAPPSATCATRPLAIPASRTPSPSRSNYAGGSLAVAHNGNLVNFGEVRARLEDEGSIFQTTSDTEVDRASHRALARRHRCPNGWPMRCGRCAAPSRWRCCRPPA